MPRCRSASTQAVDRLSHSAGRVMAPSRGEAVRAEYVVGVVLRGQPVQAEVTRRHRGEVLREGGVHKAPEAIEMPGTRKAASAPRRGRGYGTLVESGVSTDPTIWRVGNKRQGEMSLDATLRGCAQTMPALCPAPRPEVFGTAGLDGPCATSGP